MRNRITKRIWQREYYIVKREQKKCLDCNKKVEGFVRCFEHRLRMAKYQLDYRQRKKDEASRNF